MAAAFTVLSVNEMARANAQTQSLQLLLAEAHDAQSRRDFSAAAESYRKATALDPLIPELWANLGLMYHEAGKPMDAIQSFQTAIRLNAALFVPQLFLGIEYLDSGKPKAALPHLECAAKLNPKDVQAELSLGRAYKMMDRGDLAAESYLNATKLAPTNGDAWLSLGTSYLQQVESDARLMTTSYSHTPFVNLRAAEVFAEEGKLVDAENAYKVAIASPSPAPCAHAEFGITLLRERKILEARAQFALETQIASPCGLAPLGLAIADLIEGHPDIALKRLMAAATADSEFVRLSLPLFRGAVSADQVRPLLDLERTRRIDAGSIEIGSMVEKTLLSDEAPVVMEPGDVGGPSGVERPSTENPDQMLEAGQYGKCSEALRPSIDASHSTQLQILAFCSFYTGDFPITSLAAQRLKTNPTTRAQGLYWESKADEKLAVVALTRAGEIDANSPRMHVLLGDVFRQKRRWDDAEIEYRKAVALDPKSHGARLSLAIVLFTELKNDEAFDIDRGLLAQNPGNPEANLLAGEILVQQNLFNEAEPYLTNCTKLTPDLVPRLHVLLGQVYAATNRIPAAISEFKSGLSTDEDGSIHFQLGRLYQKTGDKATAEQAFRESKSIRSRWDGRARVALEQNSTDLSHQQ
jgi:tetratricopeptide (TPR) repeat protein